LTGIFGYYSESINQEKILTLLENLKYDITETASTHTCLLCKIDIKSRTEKKTTLKTENGITIVSYGEIYNEGISDLQTTIINLYKTGNLHRLKEFNGSFVAALFDDEKDKIILINDRYGTMNVFYFYDQEHFCFAPKIRLLLELGAKKEIQKDALFDFFIFGFLLGEKTFFEDIHKLPSASILEYSKGKLKHTQYWDYEFNSDKYDTRPREQLMDDLGRLWEKSVERRIKKGEKIIIPLSGGFDSRAILAAALKYCSKDNIITFTFGEKGSFDFEIAQIIAQKTGVKNVSLGIEKEDFEKQYTISLKDSETMIDATPYCAINGYQNLKTFGDRILSGFMGGEIMGSLITPQMMKVRLKSKQDYNRAGNFIFNWRRRYNHKIVTKLCSPISKYITDYRQSFNQTTNDLHTIQSKDFINYCTRWLYKNEERNYTSFCVLRFRNLFDFSIPFLDNDLVDFLLTLPPEFRIQKYLYKSMLLKRYPELFTLPTKNNYGHGIDADDVTIFLSKIILQLKRRTNIVCNKIMKRNIFQDKNINYIDYDDFLRTNKEYREFISRYINKVKNREYFNKEFIENIWRLELNGKKNYATFLGLLVTFELFLEQYVDGPEIKQPTNK